MKCGLNVMKSPAAQRFKALRLAFLAPNWCLVALGAAVPWSCSGFEALRSPAAHFSIRKRVRSTRDGCATASSTRALPSCGASELFNPYK